MDDLTVRALWGVLQAVAPALLMNLCIVGYNQLCDVDIDKARSPAAVAWPCLADTAAAQVNKPQLPLASGDFSMRQGWNIVLGSGALSLLLGKFGTRVASLRALTLARQERSPARSLSSSRLLSGALRLALCRPRILLTSRRSLTLGIAYSADHPLLRWKRSPVLAAACILVIRALAVQFGFFLHMASVLQRRVPPAGRLQLCRPHPLPPPPREAVLPPQLLFASAFMCLFSVVIAFFKDIPDVEGDLQSSVRTTSVRFGERTMLNVCTAILLLAYAGAAVFGLFSASMWVRYLMVGSHLLLAQQLLTNSREADVKDKQSLTAAYMGLWKLFYAEYLLIPLWGR